jgi:hypothetical protein
MRHDLAVAESDQGIVRALTRAWDRVRADDTRVPGVVMDLTSGRPSGCASVGWDDPQPVLEVNLQRDGQNLPGGEVMAWLLHQAAHASSGPATSMEGRWHSDGYRDAAQALGLAVEKGPTGWGRTVLARGSASRYRTEITALDRALKTWEPVPSRKSYRGPQRMQCECPEPRAIRVSPGVASKGEILCAVCGKPFVTA